MKWRIEQEQALVVPAAAAAAVLAKTHCYWLFCYNFHHYFLFCLRRRMLSNFLLTPHYTTMSLTVLPHQRQQYQKQQQYSWGNNMHYICLRRVGGSSNPLPYCHCMPPLRHLGPLLKEVVAAAAAVAVGVGQQQKRITTTTKHWHYTLWMMLLLVVVVVVVIVVV